jgi:hypothetical protein
MRLTGSLVPVSLLPRSARAALPLALRDTATFTGIIRWSVNPMLVFGQIWAGALLQMPRSIPVDSAEFIAVLLNCRAWRAMPNEGADKNRQLHRSCLVSEIKRGHSQLDTGAFRYYYHSNGRPTGRAFDAHAQRVS